MAERKRVDIYPSDKQLLFLRAKQRYVAYGGARGGGKSWVLRQKVRLLANRWAGIHMLLVRKTYPEIIQNHVNFLVPELAG